MRMPKRHSMETGRRERSLAELDRAETVKVVRLEGGVHFRNKIAAMGILPGMPLRVQRPNRRGPVLVSVFGETVMLGHGMARRIIVA